LILADIRRLPLHRESVEGVWAAASVIHLPKEAVRLLLVDLLDVIQPSGVLAATVAHGMKSRILSGGGFPAAILHAGQRVNWIERFELPVGR
jgi:hypothetical protein